MAASIPTAFETGNGADIILKQEAESVPPPEKKLKSDVDHPDMKTTPPPHDYAAEFNSNEFKEDEDEYHDMTEEEAEFYYKQLEESDGFDVSGLPYVYAFGLILPADLTNHPEDYEHYTKLAIEHYNMNNEVENSKITKFVEVVKANIQAACPLNYYITFKAEDSDGQIKTYQAKVDSAVLDKNTEVDFVRLKPGSN